ncbi:MAG: uncharacterized protein PWP10_3321 [Clostridiales bacterium]|nr:uncharacterized protein [Clostridiales bacterium]
MSCREMKPKRELIRLTVSKENVVSLDPGGKMPGRGAYVCRSRKCIEDALKGRRLDRGLKCAVGQDVVSRLLEEMEAIDAKEQ